MLVTLLSAEFEIVAAVSNGEQLLEAAILLRPDVVVSDIAMPVRDGLYARKELLARGIEIPFVFTTVLDMHLIFSVPTVSCVHKADLSDDLLLSVRAAMRGEIYFSRSFRETWGRP